MLFLIFTICFQLWIENVQAQAFRSEYFWLQKTMTFYRLNEEATDWYTARKTCEAEGTTLLVPDSMQEMDIIKVAMTSMDPLYNAIFIGVHDLFSPGDFVTVRGKPILDFHSCEQDTIDLLWMHTTPINNEEANCVIMHRNGYIENRPCDEIYPFYCKIYYRNETQVNEACKNFDIGYSLSQTTGKCYKFHEEPQTWHEAYRICAAEQSQLLIFTSEAEVKLIIDKLTQLRATLAPLISDILLIGFSDLMFPFDYRTIKGETLQEAGWNMTLSPVSESYSEMLSKRCGAINRAGELVMTSCHEPALFVCETTNDVFNFSNYKGETFEDKRIRENTYGRRY